MYDRGLEGEEPTTGDEESIDSELRGDTFRRWEYMNNGFDEGDFWSENVRIMVLMKGTSEPY